MTSDKTRVRFANRAELTQWLEDNHQQADGIWAEYPKQTSGISDLSWDALVEECLSFGWIDSVLAKVDEIWTATYIAPRRAGSGWSRRNKEIAATLIATGQMRSPGALAIERAKADGSWERFDLAEALVLPPTLKREFDVNPSAERGFNAYPERARKSILQWLYDAKQEKTLTSRIEKLVEAAKKGERLPGF
jgi:uncharacterized protein YdeI (YjbR/CyaY-like superfamily)